MKSIKCEYYDHFKKKITGICSDRCCLSERASCTQCYLCHHHKHHIIEFNDDLEKDYKDIATLYNQLKKIILTSSNPIDKYSINWIDDLQELSNKKDLNNLGNLFAELGIQDNNINTVKQKFESSIKSKSLDVFLNQLDFNDLVQRCPNDSQFLALLNDDYFDLALETSCYVLKNYPDRPQSWYYRALTLQLFGIFNETKIDYEYILECNEKALTIKPNYFESLRLKGDLLQAMKNSFEASKAQKLAKLSLNTNHQLMGHHFEQLKEESTDNQIYRHIQSLNIQY